MGGSGDGERDIRAFGSGRGGVIHRRKRHERDTVERIADRVFRVDAGVVDPGCKRADSGKGVAQSLAAIAQVERDRLRAELAALVNLRAEADSAWDSATYNAERARKAEAELAACREVVEAARGLVIGTDWNGGTHAKIYRPALVKALLNLDAARKGEEEGDGHAAR